MKRCWLFGHRYRFWSEGHVMHWTCQRGCAVGSSKSYNTATEARHYATAFDKEDSDDLGRRAPLVGLLPLRLARSATRRSAQDRQ